MASLKHELDQWNEGVIAFDQGLYEDALDLFEPIADSAKIHFNIGVVLTTLGDFEGASAAYEQATKLDQYLAIGYFQNGVANVALENYAKALKCFHDAYLYMRGNMVIDYTQLGLDFKLYSCQVLLNRALCYIELGEMDLGMTDLWRATREKQTKAHDVLDQALRDKGQDCTVFTVPQGVLYRPAESKVKNSKKKDYLGNSKVIAALDATDQFAGFQGKSAWQVQMSGPTNVAAVEDPRPDTPPNGLQRRATERSINSMGPGRSRRGTDPERPRMLEHAATFSGLEGAPLTRSGTVGPGPSALGPAGPDRPSLLTRRNTEAQRPQPLNLDGQSNNPKAVRAGDATSAAPLAIGQRAGPGQQQQQGRNRYQDDLLDEIDQQVHALHMDSNGGGTPPVPFLSSSYSTSSADSRASPTPMRSNSNNSVRPGLNRQQSNNPGFSPPMAAAHGRNGQTNGANGSNYSTSPPTNGSAGTAPVFAELRRMGSMNRGLSRGDSFRNGPTNGVNSGAIPNNASPLSYSPSVMSGTSGAARSEEGSTYLDEPVYAGLRDKLRVKCHYIDTRAVLVRVDTPLQELLQRVQEKFQSSRPLKLKYKDEDQHMLSMVDDEDWLMAQQVQIETVGNLDRMELWCFDDD